LTLGEIVNIISKFDCEKIIFTGGEPALQDLETLSNCLKPLGYYLSIETNGTINIPPGIIDWICVSPKDQEYADIKIRQKTGDELKIVYLGQSLEMYDKLRGGFDYHLLQPCYDENKDVEWNGNNFKSTVEVVKNNPGWNLSLQTHKWMGVD
jgi:organic radical activating enzyme